MKAIRIIAGACMLAASAISAIPAVAAPLRAPAAQLAAGVVPDNWTVETRAFDQQFKALKGKVSAKAATHAASVFRPLIPCRLIDTRGFPAAITIAGPLAPNSFTNVNAAGSCGIPTNGEVVGLSISISVQNLTPTAGGYVATQQQGQPVTGINAVLSPNLEWIGTTANVPILNGTGNFSLFVAASQVHVAIDVNGYYQDLDALDVGAQQLDITGAVASGHVLGVTNTAAGSALTVQGLSTGAALEVAAGAVRATGAGLNTNTFAFIHQVQTNNFGEGGTLCGGLTSHTVISNDLIDGRPDAIVFISPLSGAFNSPSSGPFTAVYLTSAGSPPCGGHWAIRDMSGATHQTNSRFSVMAILP